MRHGDYRYSTEELVAAIRVSHTWAEVLRRIGLRVAGGSTALVQKRARKLGLSVSHIKYRPRGRPRKNLTFVCKWCQRVVPITKTQRKNTYCSPDCLDNGRRRSIRSVLADQGKRRRLSESLKAAWLRPGAKERRVTAMKESGTIDRLIAASRRMALLPHIRQMRSDKARKKFLDDPEFRDRWMAASKKARRARVLVETCARKPHVPYESLRYGLVMFRSKWERDVALWMDRNNLEWTYEPLRVVVEGHPYTPDFFVRSPMGDCYVEVHRVSTAQKGDTKLIRLEAAREVLSCPIVLIEETGMASIRKMLRSR
jgi:hypothetical protein